METKCICIIPLIFKIVKNLFGGKNGYFINSSVISINFIYLFAFLHILFRGLKYEVNLD